MKRLLALLRKLIPSVVQTIVVAALLLTAFVAYNLGAGSAPAPSAASTPAAPPPSVSASTHPVDLNGDGVIFTCSMHPQIQQDEPGDCPICGMELVPLDVSAEQPASDEHAGHAMPMEQEPELIGYACAMNCLPPLEEAGECPICGMEMQPKYEAPRAQAPTGTGDPERRLTMTPEAVALASIQTTPATRQVPVKHIRLVGQLAIDPSRRAHISAYTGGRIDHLAAQYEGDVVEKGDELVLLYSPELLAVQQEFLQARAALERLPATTLESIRGASESAVAAARERLRLAGLTLEQIDEIAASGKAREKVILNAPIGGTVITRHAEEGEYVDKGARILTIAQLDVLWAEMAAYESDLPWLRPGQPVTFRSDAFPGETFHGKVAWIDPMTDVRTRTTRVRLNVENERGLLRPGMYLTARAEATLGKGEPVLVIPASAPLITGRRAVVYTEVPDAGRPAFEGREVVLGPRIESGYVVESGLAEGERVVTNGAFQIDSALQIIARPSMMNPMGGRSTTGHEGHTTAQMGTESPAAAKPAAQDHGAHQP